MIAGEQVPTAEQQAVIDHKPGAAAVVDAGAGTGKTHTIVERVAALVAGGTPPDTILLLTFAKKAAAELRGRVAARLGPVATVPTCSTFHAFAWQILRDAAYDVGLSPDADIIDDTAAKGIFRRLFDAYLIEPDHGMPGFPLGPRLTDGVREGLFALRQALVRAEVSVDDFAARARAAADAFASTRVRELRSEYLKLHKGQTHKVELALSEDAFAREVADERARIETAAALVDRLNGALEQFQRLTYDEVLVRARRLLREHTEIAQALRARYRACIVDEYQDTDLDQHAFLETLFGPALERVIAVGDVNQSIYAFRGASPENVDRVKSVSGCTTYPLSTNRRSLQEILDLAHDLIRGLPAAMHLEAHRGTRGEQIIFPIAIARTVDMSIEDARGREAAELAGRIRTLLDGGESPRNVAILSRTKTNVAVITDALTEAGIPFRLVGGAGFYESAEIRDVLAWLRVLDDPLDGAALARVAASPQIGLTDALLGRLVQASRERPPEDAGSTHVDVLARRLLLDPLDGISETDRDAVTRLRSAIDALLPSAGLPLNAALAAAIRASGVERTAVPRAPRVAANVQKLMSLANELSDDIPGARVADFLNYVAELELIEFDEREADVPAGDAVTVSTIHAAKGLEWNTVFLVNMWSHGTTNSWIAWDRASGALLCKTNSDGSPSLHYRMVDWRADESGLVPREEDRSPVLHPKDPNEELRLLYVAVTRARDRLYLSGARTVPSKSSPDGTLNKFLQRCVEWVRGQGWEVADVVAPAAPIARANGISPMPVGPVVGPAMLAPSPPTGFAIPKLSYTTIADALECPRRAHYRRNLQLPPLAGAALVDDRELSARDDDRAFGALIAAGEYGKLVHRALELWALQAIKSTSGGGTSLWAPDAASGSVAAAVAETANIKRDVRTRAERAVAAAIVGLDGWTPVLTEAPFTLDFGDEARRILTYGFIDLVAQRGAERMLVDYKSGEMGADKWPLQLALYRKALRDAYGQEVDVCCIGRITDAAFELIPVAPIADDELRAKVLAAADGLESGDATARSGGWCSLCSFRAAPCMDYPS